MVKNKKDNKKIRIGVNARFLLTGKLEGIGWYTYEIFSRLVQLMPDVSFVFFFDRSYDQQFIFAENVEARIVRPPARHPFLWYIWFEKMLPRAIKKENLDLFISPDGYMPKGLNIPTILTIHDVAFEHYKNHISWLVWKYYTHFTPVFVQRATKVITISGATERDLIDLYKLPKEKISLIYNGCSDAFRPIPQELKKQTQEKYASEKPYFIFIGALHPRKNIEGILRAFDTFRDSDNDYKLVLVGRMAWETTSIRQTFHKMKFKEDVIFTGSIGRSELNLLLGSADALLYPSFLEGFGLPIVEAMYCEVPIITSNVSCMPEIAGEAGILVNPSDIDEIAEAMTIIAENKMECSRLIAAGKDQKKKFSWDMAASSWKINIEELLI